MGKNYGWNPSWNLFVRKSKHLKIIADTSVNECDTSVNSYT